MPSFFTPAIAEPYKRAWSVQDGAVLFFQLINTRHERASTVLTSNTGFEEWGNVLGDEVMAAALIDRLLHPAPQRRSASTGERPLSPRCLSPKCAVFSCQQCAVFDWH